MLVLFEDFTLDRGRRELRHNGQLRAIEPQVFDLIDYLICHRDRVVTKEDLLAVVWNGRVVSDATMASRISSARRALGDNGDEQRLIRTVLRKGVRFVGEVREETKKEDASLALPDRPSIAVLPFQNISHDPEQDYFADGIVEEITTALSRLRWLFVVARNSSFVYKGRAVDVKQIGRELGVRYILEGSVRGTASRARITGQLIDTTTGGQLWANRFEGAREDIFELQDRVTESVVGAIAPTLERAEIERARRKATVNLDAYDYYLRGLAGIHRGSREATSEALRHFYRAFELDADYSSAYGMAALCYDLRKWNGWVVDGVHEVAETKRLARHAAALGKDDAVALCAAGFALAHVVGDVEDGTAFVARALELDPNNATAWHFSGWLASYRAEPEIAIDHLARAMRLSPFDPLSFLMHGAVSFAHFVAGRYDKATEWARHSVREQSGFLPMMRLLAASLAMAGHETEATKILSDVRAIDPSLSIADIAATTPLRRPEDLARYQEGLRRAGLPD